MENGKLVSAGEYCQIHGISQAALTKRRLKNQVRYIRAGRAILYYVDSYQNSEKRGGKR